MPPVHFGLYARSCGRSGGDAYGAYAVDADHVGFYVATVVGRGVPAALLSMCIRLLQTRDSDGPRGPGVPPDQVLRFNRALLDLGLPDSPFVTMVYGLVNRHDGALAFARGACVAHLGAACGPGPDAGG